ncbi:MULTISPECIES: sulfotransferase [unclassified Carboxylicivirga]|uniref:sulfotransferase n=1 Tax=Carboxylicivirga TaxID=1628153 RepID=UPI003D32699F
MIIKEIKYWLIRRLLKYSAPLLHQLEQPSIKKYGSQACAHQPVFIIGPPRTGSTILYQTLTQKLDVLYVDNLVNMSRGATWFGFWLSRRLFCNKGHNSSSSEHGRTQGLHAPNEGLFWYKWLPKGHDFIDFGEIKPTAINQLRQLINALMNRYKTPIVFKNLTFSVRLRLIKELYPKARIIYIKREPLYVAQSIIRSKEKDGLALQEVWSVKPREVEQLKKCSNNIQQAVRQVYYIEKQIEQDLKLFDKEQCMIINYEHLNVDALIHEVQAFTGCKLRPNQEVIQLKVSNRQQIDDAQFDALKQEIEQLDWKSYSTKI